MNNIFIPAVNDKDGKIIDVQIFKDNKQNEGLVITGLIDQEFEDSIYLSISILKRYGFKIPKFLHIHFPNYNYKKVGISVSAGVFMTLYCFLKNIKLKRKYMITGEIDLFGNIYSIGVLKQKYKLFKDSNFDYFIIPYGNKFDIDRNDNSVRAVKNIAELLNNIKEIENEIK